MKKIMGLLLVMVLCLSLFGCSKTETKKEKKKIENTKKIVTCSGSSEEEGMEMKESFSVEFENNEAKTTTFEYIYKIAEEDKELIEIFKNINFEEQAKELFGNMGIDSEKFEVRVEQLSENEIKLSLIGDYSELVEVFSAEEDKDIYKKTDYESVYKYAIKPAAEESNLKCITKEA